ncbi:MAG: DUF4837 family protein [Prolixibacteraceae bacterium]|nr:DUF4837 family protein [Prolixibacteraceae bacterium]
MKPNLIISILSVVIFVSLFSCKDDGTGMQKNITGKAGELVIIISDEAWDGNPGKMLRSNLAQEHVALPQDEPLFDLINVPHNAFKSIFKSTRNIIQTTITPNADSSGVTFKDNVWASPQATVIIQAKNHEDFVKVFDENKDKIMSYFLKAERDRLAMNYNNYYEKGIYNALSRDFGITMKIAPGFQIAKQEDDFIWLKYETPDISQGIIIYTFPYVAHEAFTTDYLVRVRDSVLRANVPGPTEGSYMSTEKRVEQVFNVRPHNGNYASEMRGLWRLINDYMGGPYISLAELDMANQRVVVAYGYVYAPSKDKRNYIRQVEAMIYSLKLNNQAENDKLSSQIRMGN